jgi:hypothetical protein
MIWTFNALNRAAASVLLGAILLLSGATVATAQGKGKGATKASPPGGRAEIVPLPRSSKPIKPEPKLKQPNAKPGKPKPPKPADKERHRAHKRCVKDCKRAHKNAIRACRGRTGADRAACERAANEAHRRCVQGCPR